MRKKVTKTRCRPNTLSAATTPKPRVAIAVMAGWKGKFESIPIPRILNHQLIVAAPLHSYNNLVFEEGLRGRIIKLK